MAAVRADLPDHGAKSYDVRAKLALAQGIDAVIRNDIETFEQAGLGYIDLLEKAERDGLGHVVAEALAEFKARVKKKKQLKAFAELELFIDLMKIKDPFEGWRALGKVFSERWPKGQSVVKAVREMRR